MKLAKGDFIEDKWGQAQRNLIVALSSGLNNNYHYHLKKNA
jgi:hypothetical protein